MHNSEHACPDCGSHRTWDDEGSALMRSPDASPAYYFPTRPPIAVHVHPPKTLGQAVGAIAVIGFLGWLASKSREQ